MNVFAFLQRLGRSLMLPVSILPVAGILLGVSQISLFFIPDFLNNIMQQSGSAIFNNLPLLFAIGTTLGLTSNSGSSILAVVVGYLVTLSTLGVVNQSLWGLETKYIMGIPSIDTGVLGGIMIGIVSATMYNKFHTIKLPSYLGFFAGKRFVPIVTACVAIPMSILLGAIWSKLYLWVGAFSEYAIKGNPAGMGFVYGFVERMLIPIGVHHIWNVSFQMQMGEFVTRAGTIVNGDIARFFAGDPTAGFLAGGYLVKMFGLPAAGFAMLNSSYKENRQLVSGLIISSVLTSFLTGITEPLEFTFLFVAPALYFMHAIFTGCAFMITNYFGIKMSTSFSNGLIDYLLCFNIATKPLAILYWGVAFFVLYYTFFSFAIRFFNLKTLGREDIKQNSDGNNQDKQAKGDNELDFSHKIIQYLGGKDNIVSVDACITRLRIALNNVSLVAKDQILKLGATAVVPIGNNIQAIFGHKSEEIKVDVNKILAENK